MSTQRIGWELGQDGTLTPLYKPTGLCTQAFILCHQCHAPLSAHGGPRRGALCEACAQPLLPSGATPPADAR